MDDQSGEVPLGKDPLYEKYFRMLARGVPKDAVKNSMTRDNLDPNILDCGKQPGQHWSPFSPPRKMLSVFVLMVALCVVTEGVTALVQGDTNFFVLPSLGLQIFDPMLSLNGGTR